MTKRLNIKQFICLFLIVFQSVITQYISFFTYLDEIFAVLIFMYAACIQGQSRSFVCGRSDVKIGLCLLTYVVIGSLSSICYQYQNLQTSISAVFLAVKWFLVFFGVKKLYIMRRFSDIGRLDFKVLKVISYLMAGYQGAALLNASIIKSFHGWDLCAKSVFMIGLLMCNWKKKRSCYICLILQWLMLISTGRSKGYAAVLLSLILFVWIIHKKRKLHLGGIIVVAILAIICAWEKVYFYFIWGAQHGYARATLFMTSFQVANDYFPLGTGWGTFCSYLADQVYSPVYYLYKISEHSELGVARKLYLEDAYWPAVIAEGGWISFLAIVCVCLFLFMEVNKIHHVNVKLYAAGLLALCYMGITTVEESGFMQPVLMCIAILMAAIIGTAARSRKKEIGHDTADSAKQRI